MASISTASIAFPAPEFKGTAAMPNGEFQEITLSQYRGKYVVLFFYPLDFTYVCPTEIVAFNQALPEFESRNVQVIGCSVDSHFTHAAWKRTPLEQGGIGEIGFPLLSDLSHQISTVYGCHLRVPGVALRGLYLIDKEGVLRHMVINDLPIGRSVEECLRVVDALQFTEAHGEVCPANWKKGMKAMKPSQEGVSGFMATMKQ